ncbi:ABC transporter ATP-binding protein [Bradyrhizobium manausense]|uniref:ABC transporter ATP-binding protein n=1 Tax=Bradyrhizobium manausense TaxID=989370 RepID=UPI001BA7A667|nr:ABC transporter ATP-binding protein [Bradyrhizobium manausense]MBR0828569.1 ABC transporter ATP-binding protein [Bradyrhizobium manausense]
MSSVLSVVRMRKTFGGLVAVNDVSFEVAEGELIGLIGPNGSGKTTMLNLISGALRPTSGEIRLAGARISGLPPERIANEGIARTFQLVRVLSSMTAAENVLAGAAFVGGHAWGGHAQASAYTLLGRVGLAGRENVPVSAMTYIDQKRVELARALAGDPKLLLLDEWLAGLNPSELLIGINLIREIGREGRTIIMVEHVMDAIRTLCTRCVVMDSGVKIADGAAAAVLADPNVIRAYLGDDDA